MEANTTTHASTSTTQADQTKKTNTTNQTGSSLFANLLNNQTNPKEITYEEYKKLSKEEIDKLFPKESMEEENKKAHSLYLRATGSDDEILNKVLFDDELNSDDSRYHNSTARGIDMDIRMWESFEKFEISLRKTEEYIKANNIKFPEPFSRQSFEMWSSIHQKIYEETVVPENEKKITAEDLFKTFDCAESYYPVVMEYNNYTKDSEYYIETRKAIDYHNKIRDEYNKRAQENEVLLNSHTNNSSTKQTQKSEEKEESKGADTVEVKQTIRELVNDIISMLRTGFTVSELEYIEKLLAEIKKKIKDNPNPSDGEKDILGKALSQLEEELAKLYKRVTGEALIVNKEKPSGGFKTTDPTMQEFEKKIEGIENGIQKLKSAKLERIEADNKEAKTISSQDEMELRKILKKES